MHASKIVYLGLTTLAVGLGVTLSDGTAQAAAYQTYMPKSWRGSYTASSGSTLQVNTYSIALNGQTYYKSSWHGWKKLAFGKVTATRYTLNKLAKYGYQSSRQWRRISKNGKVYLINDALMGEKTIWYRNFQNFHGYRIESAKFVDKFNTFYDKESHSTLSDYRPTQKSKVIFEYGNHVYPTKHEWDWFHNDYLTEYHYKKGSWHKGSTIYVGE